jgi:TolB protein
MALALVLPATAGATFPGTNGRIAFYTDRFAANYEVATVKPDGTDTKRLTHTAGNDTEATFSPNGNLILYTHTGADGVHVWRMQADGTNKQELDLGAADTFAPTWAPGGNHLAYGRGTQIWTANLNGTNRQQITSGPLLHQSADWSPSGNWIAYDLVNANGTDHDIVKINSKGGGFTDLTPSKRLHDLNPHWSPSGARLVFSRYRDPMYSDGDIFSMKADGTDVQKVIGTSADEDTPTYSPSGKRVAYTSNTTGNYELWTRSVLAIGLPMQVTNSPGLDIDPDWQPR